MRPRSLAALALLAAAACSDDPPTASDGAGSFLPCLFSSGATLEVGEVLQFEGGAGDAVCLGAGSAESEYTMVPFFASSDGEARLRVEAVGGNLTTVTGPPNPSLGGAAAPGDAWRRDAEMHARLRERFLRTLPRMERAAAGARPSRAPAAPAAAAVPAPGDLITVRIPQFWRNVDPCEVRSVRQARVGAVTERAILVNDPGNPAGGLTDAELRAFGEEFDRLVYPTDVRYFGAPTDLDANGRVIIVFTREVNALTPPNSGGGFVGGFFYAGDLFPASTTTYPGGLELEGCRLSNQGEIFYVLTPDPQGTINGNDFSRALVLRNAAGTLAHELEHLINASRRMFVNGAETFEETWLDEGLAHMAEELAFYEASGLGPRQNLDQARLQASPAVATAFERFLLDNLGRFLSYLEEPDSNSLIGEDNLPTRGATWAFLRYAADREPGSDQTLFFNLVNNRETGVANLAEHIGADPIDWMQDWTLAVYTDDAVPTDARYQQPSWNFRSIMPGVSELYTGRRRFPLRTLPLSSADSRQVRLRAGGAAFFRFGIASGGRVGLRIAPSEGEENSDSLRVSIVRTR